MLILMLRELQSRVIMNWFAVLVMERMVLSVCFNNPFALRR
ncbi:hypothetical protein CDL12_24273 [Handroanthus impetiginosus]|uniref:Uncharacterized protein n=1 Tax=Handroanthus impetiginosus TaxID=429701 RepID=A0A2G9GD34_9LAMI|nr:hypothetical protein CDL12_24273 [Handroanthus impetiginosus]